MYLCYTLHEVTSEDYIDLQTQICINIHTTLYSYALPFVFFWRSVQWPKVKFFWLLQHMYLYLENAHDAYFRLSTSIMCLLDIIF